MRAIKIRGTKYPLRGLVVVLAATTMMISISAQYSWGNLNTYMISYMKNRTDSSLTYADFIFISQSQNFVNGATFFIGGIVANKIGVWTTVLIGSIILRYKLVHIVTKH